tara:strand:+ start:578 stop:1645 length:1068 start_codon:yes stop_codon:yes gene_type:complete
MNVDDEWDKFLSNDDDTLGHLNYTQEKEVFHPEFSELYISTQTKIGYLNQPINLDYIFWKLPILNYEQPREGIIKKIMKINSINEEEVNKLEENIAKQKNITVDTISKVNSVTGKNVTFKDIRKITVGISKKDLINFRKKKKSAFYNCFATIIRIFHKGVFREINIKIFNTGKLEIPGIQDIESLNKSLKILLKHINTLVDKPVKYLPDKIETVLINSNFSCNFYINRNNLYKILKYEYNIHSLYDPCSYPGIQCKFFYNKDSPHINGTCNCSEKCSLNKKNKKNNKCDIVSFMIFRTGSILIVGNCNEETLKKIYTFIVELLRVNCEKIMSDVKVNQSEEKPKKYRKRIVLFSK